MASPSLPKDRDNPIPLLTPADVHYNRPLTNMSVAYLQDMKNYVATRYGGLVPVSQKSDLYYVYNKGDFLRNDAQKRAIGTESAGTGVGVTTGGPFLCDTVAIHEDIPFDNLANQDKPPLDVKRDAAQNVTQKLVTRCEVDFMSAVFASGKWGLTLTGVDSGAGSTGFIRFDVATSDPVSTIRKARQYIHGQTGFWPNKLIVSADVFEALIVNPSVLNRIKYGALGGAPVPQGYVNEQILGSMCSIDDVMVASAIYNTAAEGATDSISGVASNGMLLMYIPPNPGPRVPSAMYTFVWNNQHGSPSEVGGMGMRVADFPIMRLKSQRIEAEMPYDHHIIATDLGVFFASCCQHPDYFTGLGASSF